MKSKNLLAISFAMLTSFLIFTGCFGGGGGSGSDESPSILGTWKSQDGSTRLDFPNSSTCNGIWKGTACSGTSVVDDEDIDLNILLVSGESINLKGKISGDQLKLIEGTTQTIIIFKDYEPTPTPTPTPEPKDNNTNVSGTWEITITETYDEDGSIEAPKKDILIISQSGNILSIRVRDSNYSASGTINGDRVYIKIIHHSSAGSIKDLNGVVNGNRMSGTYTELDYENDGSTSNEAGNWTGKR